MERLIVVASRSCVIGVHHNGRANPTPVVCQDYRGIRGLPLALFCMKRTSHHHSTGNGADRSQGNASPRAAFHVYPSIVGADAVSSICTITGPHQTSWCKPRIDANPARRPAQAGSAAVIVMLTSERLVKRLSPASESGRFLC
jgi:hypothetical protein